MHGGMGESEQSRLREVLGKDYQYCPRVWNGLGDAARSVARQWWYVGAVATFFSWMGTPRYGCCRFFGFDVLVSMGRLESQHLLPAIARPLKRTLVTEQWVACP